MQINKSLSELLLRKTVPQEYNSNWEKQDKLFGTKNIYLSLSVCMGVCMCVCVCARACKKERKIEVKKVRLKEKCNI